MWIRNVLKFLIPPACIGTAVFFLACENKNEHLTDGPRPLYSTPIIIPFNPVEGYTHNLMGRPIAPIINSRGDTIQTGIPIPVRGQVIHPDSILKPITISSFTPRIVPGYTNVRAIPEKQKVVRVNRMNVQRFEFPGDSTFSFSINSFGDTIPTGISIPMPGLHVPCLAPRIVTALKPRMRDHAMFDIQYLDFEEGLNIPVITCIEEDRNGNLWFGTFGGGAIRYDGATFISYTAKEGLPNDRVTSILEDRYGNIWFATDGAGICRYDGTSFLHFTERQGLISNNIQCILEDKEGNLWFGTNGGGACRYKMPEGDQPGTFTHYSGIPELASTIFSIFEDSKGHLWFGSGLMGVSRYDPPQNGAQGIFTRYTINDGLPNNQINAICEDSKGNLFFGTQKGLAKFDGTAFTSYTTAEGLPNNQVKTIYPDRSGKLWIGTTGGGACYYDGESFTVFAEKEGLSNNRINAFHEDKSGNHWLATEGGGVCRINLNSFVHYSANEGFSQHRVTAMHEDRNGNVWFGTNGDGVFKYVMPQNGTSGTFAYYPDIQGFSDSHVFSIEEDNYGNLWFGTWTFGVWSFDGKAFTHHKIQNNFREVKVMHADRKGNMWFGTHGGGLSCYRPAGHEKGPLFIRYRVKEGLPKNRVSCILEDNTGNLWFSTLDGGGITRFEPSDEGRQGIFTHYSGREGLSSNGIVSMIQGKNGTLWFGTANGVNCFQAPKDTFSGQFIYYSDLNGLPQKNIKSLLEDSHGNIWVSTHSGLGRINKAEGREPASFVTSFQKSDGIKGSLFDFRCAMRDSKGRMWWGHEKAVEMLDVNAFQLSDEIPQPHLKQIEINEDFIDFRNLPDSTKKNITYTGVPVFENYPLDLKLPYTKDHLTFHFSAIDWAAPHKIRYSYIMEGLEDTWSIPSQESKAQYRNLPPGKFRFKVRAIGETQKWSDPFEYNFIIRPPLWLTWWAYVLYGLSGLGIVYNLYRFQLKRKLEISEKKRLVELDNLKNKLFTNITHEFRTPLTLIHGPLAHALSEHAVLDEKDIRSMHHQSRRLQQLITQMLDLQKVEAGRLKPQYVYGEIVNFIRYLFDAFTSLAKEKGVKLEFHTEPPEIMMDYDEEKLTQIVSNLVSNAIRHTPRNGKVSLTLNTSPKSDKLFIQLQDTGVGVSTEELPFIFDRYYQSARAAQGGTGVGLALAKNLVELFRGTITVESKLNAGTTFKVCLPVTSYAHSMTPSAVHSSELIVDAYDDEARFSPPADIISDKPIILIVEDHPEVAQFVATCLSRDFTTLIAMDGNEGLRKAFESIPDLVVSDVMMPGKNGFELCATLKSDIQTSHIPVILLTGRGDQPALMEGIEQGADAYVIKPFEPQELILRVKKLLELRANLSQYYRKNGESVHPETAVKASARENAFLHKIRSFIEEQINNPQFNMNMLSRHMAMSHPQLHRKITALTGESTGKFVRSVRLTKATDLLKNSDLTISEIAYESGFSEPGYFTKVFSKEYNLSPSDYRSGLTGR